MKQSLNLTTGLYTNAVKTALRSEYNVSAVPRLTFDWDLNRYTSPVATNTPAEDDEGFDIESFPIESIVEPIRPVKGIAKARVNESVVSSGYLKPKDPRFYVSDEDDVYKYWTAPFPTNSAGNFPNHTDGQTSARPRVTYNRVVKANKIVIVVENTWATPINHSVKISKTIGGAFTAVGGTNPVIDTKTGTLTLYYNGTAWVSTRPATLVETDVSAIEFAVTRMGPGYTREGAVMWYTKRGKATTKIITNGSYSSLNVISIAAHYEADLTNRLMEVSDEFDMSEKSQLYPIGTITSNTATVVLSNDDGAFNKENPASPYNITVVPNTGPIQYSLIEPNAEVNLEYIYTIGTTKHSVQEFKMYVSSFTNGDKTTTVELEDYSKYLKEIKPNPFMVEGKTSTEIIWRTLDSVGFADYEIQADDLLANTSIPVFWTTGEETVWEILDEVAKATQTAIYIDSYGILQVRTRQAAFRTTNTIDWNLLGTQRGNSLPDITEWNATDEYEANKIEVKYKTTKWKINSQGKPAMSKVWEPDGTLVVRSSPLVHSVINVSNYIYIDQKEVKLWPYKSKVQIDGEVIQYDGKHFVYYTYTEGVNLDGSPKYTSPVQRAAIIKSEDDYHKYNRMTPVDYRYMNRLTGGLYITERAVWNTEQRNHEVEMKGYTTKLELYGKKSNVVRRVNTPGFGHKRKESLATINTPKNMNDASDTLWAIRGSSIASSYRSYGTRFRFNKDKASTTQIAGISYQMSGARENGYYVEVRTSASLSAAERNKSNEVSVYSRKAGRDTLIAKGAATAIGQGIWYEIDIYHSGSGNTQRVSVFLNGQLVAKGNTIASTAQGESGRFGFFARGKTNADFEYLYAIARNINEPMDDYGFYDLKYGGIRGGQWEREYVWEMRTRRRKIRKKKWKKESYRHNLYLFDEFGSYVHEVREFDVKFDPSPVRSSYLYNTNEWFAAVPEYTSNPFGAKFIIANTSRNHAVLNGEDTLSYAGAGSSLNQACVVLGQNLEVADDESVIKKNEAAIRSRGEIPVELSSDWIQNKSMAEAVANWMSTHWSMGVDEASVKIFGNPLIEIGDIVDVDFPAENMAPTTHKYFVVGVQNSFGNGVETTLNLRRRR